MKGGGGSVMVWGDVFCSRSWLSYTWQGECKCLSEQPLITICSLWAFPYQATNKQMWRVGTFGSTHFNIMFGVKMGKWRSQWKVKEEVSWFSGCFLQKELDILYSYKTRWMPILLKLIRTSFVNMRFLPCENLNHQNMQNNVPCDYEKQVKQFLQAKNI